MMCNESEVVTISSKETLQSLADFNPASHDGVRKLARVSLAGVNGFDSSVIYFDEVRQLRVPRNPRTGEEAVPVWLLDDTTLPENLRHISDWLAWQQFTKKGVTHAAPRWAALTRRVDSSQPQKDTFLRAHNGARPELVLFPDANILEERVTEPRYRFSFAASGVEIIQAIPPHEADSATAHGIGRLILSRFDTPY